MIEKLLQSTDNKETIKNKLNEVIDWINEYDSNKWTILKAYINEGAKAMAMLDRMAEEDKKK